VEQIGTGHPGGVEVRGGQQESRRKEGGWKQFNINRRGAQWDADFAETGFTGFTGYEATSISSKSRPEI